jgi:hypothetical protein
MRSLFNYHIDFNSLINSYLWLKRNEIDEQNLRHTHTLIISSFINLLYFNFYSQMNNIDEQKNYKMITQPLDEHLLVD